MEAAVITVSVVGSIFSILAYFLPCNSTKSRLMHSLYTLIIAALVVTLYHYQSLLHRDQQMRQQAQVVLDLRSRTNHRGFIQGALSFLEKYKDRLPDTYARAVTICTHHNCDESSFRSELELGIKRDELYEVAEALSGILKAMSSDAAQQIH